MKDLSRTRSRGATALSLGVALGLAVALTACGGGSGGPVTPLPGGTTTTPSGSPTSTTPTATTPGQQKVLDANTVLGNALLSLANTSRTIQTDNGLVPAARSRVNSAANAARSDLKVVRAAAYGTGKSCSTVLSRASSARSAAGSASAYAGSVRTALNRLRADVSRLDASVAVVRVDLVKLQAAVKAEPNPPETVTTAEVSAAVAGAVTLHKATVAFIADATSKTAGTVSAAAQAAANATSVASKTC